MRTYQALPAPSPCRQSLAPQTWGCPPAPEAKVIHLRLVDEKNTTRETNRQTDRQTKRQTGRQADKEKWGRTLEGKIQESTNKRTPKYRPFCLWRTELLFYGNICSIQGPSIIII